MKEHTLSRWQIWRMPLALGLFTAFGLGAALLGDGIWDVLSWVALAIPALVIIWHIARSQS